MIQHILTLLIVYSTAAYVVFSIIRSLWSKKTSHCGGCTACSLKDLPVLKQGEVMQPRKFEPKKLKYLKQT